MILKLQIISLLFSLLYGFIFYFLVCINSKYLYNNKFSIVIDILFIINNVFIYFIILRFINNGIFHIYFLFLLIIGFVVGYYVDKKRRI